MVAPSAAMKQFTAHFEKESLKWLQQFRWLPCFFAVFSLL